MVAARRKSAEIDETVADEVEDGPELDGGETVEVEDDLDETSLDEAFGEEEGLESEGELDDEVTELAATPVETETEDAADEVVAPPDASFDDEGDDEGIVAAVTGEDDDGQEVEGLRDGEFVCRSCYMAKRETQLADPERLHCRDCA